MGKNPFRLVAIVVAIAAVLAGCSGCLARRVVIGARSPVQQSTGAVELTVVCPSGQIFIGTGVALSADRVLTAYHVVSACGGEPMAIVAEQGGGIAAIVAVEAIAPTADVARLVALVGSELTAAPIAIGPAPSIGEPVCVAARNPYSARRCGVVEYDEGGPHGIRHSVIVEPGNSGAGLYDRDGRLVGIVTKLYQCGNGQICGGRATGLDERRWVVSWR